MVAIVEAIMAADRLREACPRACYGANSQSYLTSLIVMSRPKDHARGRMRNRPSVPGLAPETTCACDYKLYSGCVH